MTFVFVACSLSDSALTETQQKQTTAQMTRNLRRLDFVVKIFMVTPPFLTWI